MAIIDLVMPKMGESIMEATILKWVKQVGEPIELDETILEIATDKVDTEIPSPISGVIAEILFSENEIVEVGKVIARISTEAEEIIKPSPSYTEPPVEELTIDESPIAVSVSENSDQFQAPSPQAVQEKKLVASTASKSDTRPSNTTRFYSPLVRTIAQREAISKAELDTIAGSGANGRVTKRDILSFVSERTSGPKVIQETAAKNVQTISAPKIIQEVASNVQETISKPKIIQEVAANVQENISTAPAQSISGGTEIIEMDRMRKLIAEHMVNSKRTAAHVTSFVEVDVTNIVEWRERVKPDFLKNYGEKITFTPIFMEAVTKAIKDFPMINCSLEGDKIIKKNFVNLGMAAALPSGNLIVPVIKDADHLNLLGLTKAVNDLANRARQNKLKADEIQNGTFTMTNVGTFGNVMGTPIINQPQVAILAVGAIKKKPAVVETEMGDLIAIRHMMFLSLSYDHRIVDGFLGGSFVRRVADYLEQFDKKRNI